MLPILQRFEFSYVDGEHFWDRSGQLAFALRKLMPGLRVTGSAAEQRNFVDDATGRDLVFGISLASIESIVEGDEAFIAAAAAFLQELVRTFEVQWLRSFAFRYALGRRCASGDEARSLFWKMVGKEEEKKFRDFGSGGQVHAVQAEYHRGGTEATVRFGLLERASDPAKASEIHPYFVAIEEVRGLKPIATSGFDAEAFMRNVAVPHTQQILARIGPANDEQPSPHS